MTRPRTDRDYRGHERREQTERSRTRDGRPRAANGQPLDKEDQADSGPDRDHAITRRTRDR